MNNKELKGERLYLDLAQYGGVTEYSTDNICMLPAVFKAYPLAGVEMLIFLYICQTYNNGSRGYTPVITTCKELSKIASCAEITVKKHLTRLISDKLLLRVRNNDAGAKYGYLPNVKLIHTLMLEFSGLTPPSP